MKNARTASALAIGLLAYTVSFAASAALPSENLIPGAPVFGSPSIHFDNVALTYKPGKVTGKKAEDDRFFAVSTPSTTLSFMGVNNNATFTGDFILDAFISPKGTLKSGTFGFYSNDAMFGGAPLAGYNWNSAGKNCDTAYLVFGGDITQFGWSESFDLSTTGYDVWANATEGMLHFQTANRSGWAHDLWGSPGSEHIIINVLEGLNLNVANAVTSWTGTGDGIAIIPVPAAAWLLGSGLIGLFGISRKRVQRT